MRVNDFLFFLLLLGFHGLPQNCYAISSGDMMMLCQQLSILLPPLYHPKSVAIFPAHFSIDRAQMGTG
jgi:hypothetical protein